MRNPLWPLAFVLALAGCSRAPDSRRAAPLPRTLPLEVLADRAPDASLPPARVESLGVAAGAPRAKLELLAIAPERFGLTAPPPDAAPGAPGGAGAPTGEAERLQVDDRLRPPVPRTGTTLRLAGARGRWVELDVRVDEDGGVTQVEPAGGDADSALVAAAIAAARATRWYPATRLGRPVAVWSRQRFEVGR